MADSLTDLVARLRAAQPALADVPDDVLHAEVLTQLQARGGPSVGDALGDAPTFRTTNEKTPEGDAVVRAPVSPWTKAATIGAPGIGERYSFPSVGEVLASDSPLQLLAQFVTGHGRPRSVANADPLGVTAFHEGKGPMPMFMGSTDEVKGLLGSVGEEVGAAGRGLYSRVDDAVSLLPKNGAHPNKIAGILKSNASAEELAYRQVPEFLASKGNATVTPGELQAHLAAHPAPLPKVSVLAEVGDRQPLFDALDRELEAGRIDEAEWSERMEDIYADKTGKAKYAQYQLPGGKDYRETLLTLPTKAPPFVPPEPLTALPDTYAVIRDGSSTPPTYGVIPRGQTHARSLIGYYAHSEEDAAKAAVAYLNEQESLLASGQYHKALEGQQYRSGHFDEPNIVVHTRSNTRTLPTGERGRFVEEVQSDWHQAGKEKGYQQPIPPEASTTWNDYAKSKGLTPAEASHAFGDYTDPRFASWMEAYDRSVEIANTNERAVPDAPFKETWPDLGLKQQLLEAAKDPEAQWLGFTSGETQADRYNLRKMIDRLYYDPQQQRLIAFGTESSGAQGTVLDEIVAPNKLADTIGKEASKRLLEQPIQQKRFLGNATDVHVLEGANLDVGGEGMRHFYDNLLPKRLQKIVKPFGGTVERMPVSAGTKFKDAWIPGQPEVGTHEPQTTPAWIVRLTPAMKARILQEGLPLGLLLGAAGPSVAEALRGTVPAHAPE